MSETEKTERFFVDKRTGCVAVRDRLSPGHDPDYKGLHPDTPDIILYFIGTRVPKDWASDGPIEYTISPLDVCKCEMICGKLNSLVPKRPDNPAVSVEMDWTTGIKVSFKSGIYQYYSYSDIKNVFNENLTLKQSR